MKKFNILLISIISIFLICSLCSCNNSDGGDITPSNLGSSDTTSSEINITAFREVEATSENLDIYREEVSKRLSTLGEGDSFFTDKEWEVISHLWNYDLSRNNRSFTQTRFGESSNCYYPVVFREGDSPVVWYTTESGTVLLEGKRMNTSNYVGQLHSIENEDVIMKATADYTVSFSQKSEKVMLWEFGEPTKEYSVPTKSEYCGFSVFEGYIFRSGTDVYALRVEGTPLITRECVCIAHNVKYVIDADYAYGSDPWSQPLFLMTDGSIKAYIAWEGNQDSVDDDSHLCDLQYEGGYR